MKSLLSSLAIFGMISRNAVDPAIEEPPLLHTKDAAGFDLTEHNILRSEPSSTCLITGHVISGGSEI